MLPYMAILGKKCTKIKNDDLKKSVSSTPKTGLQKTPDSIFRQIKGATLQPEKASLTETSLCMKPICGLNPKQNENKTNQDLFPGSPPFIFIQ